MQTIELSENSIQIVNKQNLTENSVIVVKVDVGSLPLHKATEYMDNIKGAFKDIIGAAKLVVMSNKHDLSIVETTAA